MPSYAIWELGCVMLRYGIKEGISLLRLGYERLWLLPLVTSLVIISFRGSLLSGQATLWKGLHGEKLRPAKNHRNIMELGPPAPGAFWIDYKPGCQLLCSLMEDPKSKWSSKLLPDSWTSETDSQWPYSSELCLMYTKHAIIISCLYHLLPKSWHFYTYKAHCSCQHFVLCNCQCQWAVSLPFCGPF